MCLRLSFNRINRPDGPERIFPPPTPEAEQPKVSTANQQSGKLAKQETGQDKNVALSPSGSEQAVIQSGLASSTKKEQGMLGSASGREHPQEGLEAAPRKHEWEVLS